MALIYRQNGDVTNRQIGPKAVHLVVSSFFNATLGFREASRHWWKTSASVLGCSGCHNLCQGMQIDLFGDCMDGMAVDVFNVSRLLSQDV